MSAPDIGQMSWEDIRTITQMVGLKLSEERMNQLTTTLSAYLTNLQRLRQIDVGDTEPPTITYDREART